MKNYKRLLLIVLLFLLSCNNNNTESKVKILKSDNINLFFPKTKMEIVYLLVNDKITDDDICKIANYKSHVQQSNKVNKLYKYGGEYNSCLFFTKEYLLNEDYRVIYPNDQKALYANFLTQDWFCKIKYKLSSLKLSGKDSITDVFIFNDNEYKNICLGCVSKTISTNNNVKKEEYFVDIFNENCNTEECFVSNITPVDKEFKKIMNKVRNYYDFEKLWFEYKKKKIEL